MSDPTLHEPATWEELVRTPTTTIRRRGRFIVVDLLTPHRVISTSVRGGGQTEHLRHLVNHQSCEGAAHHARHHVIIDRGQEQYHDDVCAEAGIAPHETATMGTAANMQYAAIATERDADVTVTAVVTAGVATNAICGGDPATWRETTDGMTKIPDVVSASAGTINILLLIDTPLTIAALARAVVTMTEGKSAALQRLAAPSRSSSDLATGTGTDQYCIAAPLAKESSGRDNGEGGEPGRAVKPLTSASPHVKLGEIIGVAVRRATLEALRWQNGLEPSYTRGLFHALGRYGVREEAIFADLAQLANETPPISSAHEPRDGHEAPPPLLSAADLELLRKNDKAAFYEPLAGAAAHALAAVLDRVRHGTLPPSAARDAIVQQAALLAANLATRPDRWPTYRARLLPFAPSIAAPADLAPADVKRLVLAAIAIGWSDKWAS